MSLHSVTCRLAVLAAAFFLALGGIARAETVTAEAAARPVVLTGFTRARAAMDLVAEEAGRVTRVSADVGDAIGADGEFARVDATFIELDLEDNRARRARLASRIAYDAKEAARYRDLVRRETAAQATLDGLEQTLDSDRHELAALEVARRVLEERLARTRVPAPKGWLVMARDVEPGQWVAAGQVLGRAGDFSTLLAPFALTPEQYEILRSMGPSIPVMLMDRGRAARAAVYRVEPGFDPETRKIKVELALPGGGDLRGGLRVRLELPMPAQPGTVLLPAGAVVERYEENWVTREGGERVRVVVLGEDGGLLRVSGQGLRPGDAFLVDGKE